MTQFHSGSVSLNKNRTRQAHNDRTTHPYASEPKNSKGCGNCRNTFLDPAYSRFLAIENFRPGRSAGVGSVAQNRTQEGGSSRQPLSRSQELHSCGLLARCATISAGATINSSLPCFSAADFCF